MAGLSLRNRVRGSGLPGDLGAEPLLLGVERGQLKRLLHLIEMPLGRFHFEVPGTSIFVKTLGSALDSLEGSDIPVGLEHRANPAATVT